MKLKISSNLNAFSKNCISIKYLKNLFRLYISIFMNRVEARLFRAMLFPYRLNKINY